MLYGVVCDIVGMLIHSLMGEGTVCFGSWLSFSIDQGWALPHRTRVYRQSELLTLCWLAGRRYGSQETDIDTWEDTRSRYNLPGHITNDLISPARSHLLKFPTIESSKSGHPSSYREDFDSSDEARLPAFIEAKSV